jgi:phosphoglycolate phosphatase-like HAD superfamily hydrolase
LNSADLLIFDLDGTLLDSKKDLADSVNATRGFMGLAPLPLEQVSSYVGNGAPMLVRRALPDADEAGWNIFWTIIESTCSIRLRSTRACARR